MKSLRIVFLKFILVVFIGVIPFLPKIFYVSPAICYAVSGALAVAYFVVGWRELLLNDEEFGEDEFRINYLPFITITKRIVKIFGFGIIGIILLAPETTVFKLEPMVLTLFLGEILFFVIAVKRKMFSIRFYKDYLFFKQEKEEKVFAAEVKHIEFRYEIFFLVLHSNKTFKMNPEFMPAGERQKFHRFFMGWAAKNSIPFTEEAKQKLSQFSL